MSDARFEAIMRMAKSIYIRRRSLPSSDRQFDNKIDFDAALSDAEDFYRNLWAMTARDGASAVVKPALPKEGAP